MSRTTRESPTRCLIKRTNHPWSMAWLVGTGLGAVAFAEPRQRCPFRGSGFTEPAWRLVPVPPLRTRRADFPHRAPQVALTVSVRQSHDEVPDTGAQTTRGSRGSTSTAGDAGCVCAALESTAAEPHSECR